MADEKSKEKLRKAAAEEITKMFESILDYVQVACPTPDTYKVLRSKILRVGNNCIRALQKRIDDFDVAEHKKTIEEIIEIKQPKK